jgi:hypothetical protein
MFVVVGSFRGTFEGNVSDRDKTFYAYEFMKVSNCYGFDERD